MEHYIQLLNIYQSARSREQHATATKALRGRRAIMAYFQTPFDVACVRAHMLAMFGMSEKDTNILLAYLHPDYHPITGVRPKAWARVSAAPQFGEGLTLTEAVNALQRGALITRKAWLAMGDHTYYVQSGINGLELVREGDTRGAEWNPSVEDLQAKDWEYFMPPLEAVKAPVETHRVAKARVRELLGANWTNGNFNAYWELLEKTPELLENLSVRQIALVMEGHMRDARLQGWNNAQVSRP